MLRRNLSLALILLLLAAPIAAYTIYLKDGSRLIAKEKYSLDGDRALIVLQNGTQTFLAASEIDVARTEAANRNNYGTAMVLQDGQFTETAPAPESKRQESLTDLAGRSQAQPRQQARRPVPARPPSGDYLDLLSSQRQPFRNLDLAGEIQEVFLAQGVASVQFAQGTAADRVLLEITTDSEASVFRALEVAADALLHVRTRTSAPVSAFEIVLVTSSRSRGGQFLLDPVLASQLADGAIELPAFYVQNVQY
ncbi:MAG: hypothetical protein ACE5EG_07785 [Thermoanaerobaculia bacterium]